ncbi:MAG: MBL fold metallo-hydrolase [Candidatus Moraniibacteriota bacterium]
MSKQKIYRRLLVLIFCAGLFAAGISWLEAYQKITTVTFLAVGEGDAILISQGSNQILIDGGRTGKDLLSRLGRRMLFWDRTVEIVIATHPDADHIGGFTDLLVAYHVDKFLYTGAESKTETYALLQKALAAQYTDMLKIFRGGTVRLPGGGDLSIEYPLTPLPQETAEANTGSIVARFTYGATQMLFTGDLPSEETVLPDTAPVAILKVAHHGSRYSTSAAFLDLVKPQEAVISVGKNMYGHPTLDVIERLLEHHVRIHRTDTEGDISYRCTEELGKCVFVQ